MDEPGAADLSGGLAGQVKPGRIYAGQGGATKWPSGEAGGATLCGESPPRHLGGNVRGSTFRLTLAAVLADEVRLPAVGPRNITRVGEIQLSHWMQEHLAVAVYPFEERDALADLDILCWSSSTRR